MRAARLLNLQMLLETRGRMSATELSRLLEVSVRTLYRDVDHLSSAGVPVYAERGRAGGFQLLPGWKTTLTGMTPEEAQAVFLGGLAGPAEELGLAPSIPSAQLKLLTSLPAEWRDRAKRVSERLHLDPLDWYRESDPPRWLAEVSTAVWEGHQIAIDYASWTRRTRHVVHPLGLVLKAGMWYLIAAVDREARTYRVSSIEQVEVLNRRVQRPRRFDLPVYWRESVARFERELYASRARVAVTARGLAHLRQLGAPVAHALRDQTAPADGVRCELEIPVESDAQAAAQLLRLAPEVEVLGPPALRQAVRKRLAECAEMYRMAVT